MMGWESKGEVRHGFVRQLLNTPIFMGCWVFFIIFTNAKWLKNEFIFLAKGKAN